ncbi:hypothetical protein [Microbispora rosea]|uniref:hypothetical protein n=1 Tax=Microbispora rosea TaxID=58117 RepID=UPI0033DD926D
MFAMEDCRHVTRRLEADLLRAGYRVVRVTTQLMAGQRRSGRGMAARSAAVFPGEQHLAQRRLRRQIARAITQRPAP